MHMQAGTQVAVSTTQPRACGSVGASWDESHQFVAHHGQPLLQLASGGGVKQPASLVPPNLPDIHHSRRHRGVQYSANRRFGNSINAAQQVTESAHWLRHGGRQTKLCGNSCKPACASLSPAHQRTCRKLHADSRVHSLPPPPPLLLLLLLLLGLQVAVTRT